MKMKKVDVFTNNNKHSHSSQQVFSMDKCVSYKYEYNVIMQTWKEIVIEEIMKNMKINKHLMPLILTVHLCTIPVFLITLLPFNVKFILEVLFSRVGTRFLQTKCARQKSSGCLGGKGRGWDGQWSERGGGSNRRDGSSVRPHGIGPESPDRRVLIRHCYWDLCSFLQIDLKFFSFLLIHSIQIMSCNNVHLRPKVGMFFPRPFELASEITCRHIGRHLWCLCKRKLN